MNADFLLPLKKNLKKCETRLFGEQLKQYVKIAKDGIPASEIEKIISVLVSVELEIKTFKSLIMCLVPEQSVPNSTLEKIVRWVALRYRNHDCSEQVECVFVWIANILEYEMADKEVVAKYYELIFIALKYFPMVISHLLCILTKPRDVQLWRVTTVQRLSIKLGPQPYLHALLSVFKKYNPDVPRITLPAQNSFTNAFVYRNPFSKKLRDTLKNVKNAEATRNFEGTVAIPAPKKKRKLNKFALIPSIKYPDQNKLVKKFHVLDAKNVIDLTANYYNLVFPIQTLALFKSELGVCALGFAKRNYQDQFFRNLHFILERDFIKNVLVDTEQSGEMFKNLISLSEFYQQGFNTICRFVSSYLKSWDGYENKYYVYKLISWCIFDNYIELNRNILKPLYTLYTTSDPPEMCEIIVCLMDLITELYLTFDRLRSEQNYIMDLEGPQITFESIPPMLESLPRFVAALIKRGLYVFPYDNQVLTVAISFYEDIYYLETMYDAHYFTIVSSAVVYNCLFSNNLGLLNRLAKLLLWYKKPDDCPKNEEKWTRLQSYGIDISNCVWMSRAFQGRNNGCVFRGLNAEDVDKWKDTVNLDLAFDLKRHIMFEAHKSQIAHNRNVSRKALTKAELLEIIQEDAPHLVKLIEMVEIDMGNNYMD